MVIIKRALRKDLIFSLSVFLITLFFCSTAFAGLTQEVAFQARVKKKDGSALSSGAHTFIFRLYSASTGGSSLWSETQTITPDTSTGIISCYLATVTAFPTSLNFNSTYYLSIEVDDDGEMSPRIKIVPSMYALNSNRLGGLEPDQFLRSDTADTMSATLTLSPSSGNALVTTAGSIGVGTESPAATALLDLTSTAKGFLAPRMTTTQRDAISSPATGLLIYNTTTNQYNYYSGTAWGTVGAVDGSGTTNYLTKWSDAESITSAVAYDDGTNIGIGTTSPSGRLSFAAATTAAGGIYFGTDTTLYRSAADTLKTDDALVVTGALSAGSFSLSGNLDMANNLILNIGAAGTDFTAGGGLNLASGLDVTGTANATTLTEGGVGVPTVNDKLNAFSATTSAELAGVISDETGTAGKLVFDTTPTFVTSITTPLAIGGTATSSDLSLKTTSGVGAAGADMHFLTGDNGATEAMTILNSGSVGIGTTAPAVKLDVSGTANATTLTEGSAGVPTVNDNLSVFSATTSAQLAGVISDETGTAGKLVFDTTPTFVTSITAPLAIGGTATTSDLSLKTTSGIGAAGADMHFLTGNNGATEAMTILNSGYVGIGTTNPSVALHVVGDPNIVVTSGNALTVAEALTGTSVAGKINLGRSTDGFESVSFDPTLGSAGKFVFTAPLQVAASSPAITFFDPSDPTNTEKQKSIEYGSDAGGTAGTYELRVGNAFYSYFPPPGTAAGYPPPNRPLIQIGPNPVNSPNTYGIFIGANTPSGFPGDILHLQENGNTRFMITRNGDVRIMTGYMSSNWPVLNTYQTWYNSAVAFQGWRLDVYDQGSSIDSLFLDLQKNSISQFSVRKDGLTKIGPAAGNTFNNPSADSAVADLYVTGNLEVDGSVWLGNNPTDTVTIPGTLQQSSPSIITSMTSPQLSVRYDPTNRLDTSVSSMGTVTFDSAGTAPGFVFSDNLDANSGLDVAGQNLTVGATNFSVAPSTGNITTAGTIAVNGGNITSTVALAITPASNQNLNVATSGTGAFAVNTSNLYINANNGLVGIGTSTPTNRLEIGALGTSTSTLTQANSDRFALTGSYWTGAAEAKHRFNLQNIASTQTNETGRLAIGWDATELMSILHIGKVGIGTVSPAAGLTIGTGTNSNATSANDMYVTGVLEVDGKVWLGDASVDDITIAGSLAQNAPLIITSATTPQLSVRYDGSNLVNISTAANGAITVDATGAGAAVSFSDNLTTAGNLAVNGGGINSTGALTVTPGAGTNFNLALSTTGDFAVNTNQLYVDTSAASVGIGTTLPAATALLDLVSTTKGFLAPRMTTVQRDAITTPATGLLIYNTTANQYQMYNGSTWKAVGEIDGTGTANYLPKYTDSDSLGDSVVYETGGLIGIGTTAPATKLDVSGTANATTLTEGSAGVPNLNDNLSVFSATTSAQLAGVISDETGTAGKLVFDTTPTFVTSITTPLAIGGTATTSDLSLKTTSGIGAAGADMHFLTGNNGGTEAMTILNDGSVGIGTTAPATKLDVSGLTLTTDATGTVGAAKFTASLTKNDALAKVFSGVLIQPTLNTGVSNTNTTLNVLNIDTTNTVATGVTTNLIRAGYGAADKFIVDSTGAITTGTIGWGSVTSKPANLDVDSTDDLTTATNFAGDLSGLYNNLQLGAGVIVDADINTTANIAQSKVLNLTTDLAAKLADTGDTITGSLNFSGVASDITTATNEHLALMPNGTGSVGIGTTSPNRQLELASTAASDNNRIRLNSTDAGAYWSGFEFSNATTFKGGLFRYHADDRQAIWTPTVEALTVLTGGSVGIGTTAPGALLDLNAASGNTVMAFSEAGVGKWSLRNSGADDSFRIGDANQTVLTVLQGGSVGIGTTAPAVKLDVSGTANATTLTEGGTGVPNLNDNLSVFSATTSAQLAGVISDETGTAGKLVFDTTPTFVTSITTPLAIGGTATTSDLSLKTTSGIGAAGADMHFLTGNNGATEAMTILNDGKVGIGIIAPTSPLHVVGDIKLTGRIRQGSLGDLAEMMPLAKCVLNPANVPLPSPAALIKGLPPTVIARSPKGDEAIPKSEIASRTSFARNDNEELRKYTLSRPEAGDVVVIDENGGIRRSYEPFAAGVVGIISTNPAQVLRDNLENAAPVALNGIVPCKVTNENGAIKPGDLLVSSSTPGHAMRAGKNPPAGTVIGKALARLEAEAGVVEVMVMMK